MDSWDINKIKQNLNVARENGWWIACFYWEQKLKESETFDA